MMMIRSSSAWVDPNGVEAIDLDDCVFAHKVEILTAGRLSTLSPPDTHDLDGTPVIDNSIAWPDMASDCDLSCAR